MPLVPLLPIFHSFNREFFEGSLTEGVRPLVSLRWSDGRLRKTAGFYRRFVSTSSGQECEIVLSRPLLAPLPQTAIESTLCHEMIHAWVDLVLNVREGHGPNFYSRMDSINAAQQNFKVTVCHQFPVPRTSPKWWAICNECGFCAPYKRRVSGAACKHCCNTFHGGQWHHSCLLEYKPI